MNIYIVFVVLQEKARLEEALSSESGQQQLAIRTYRIQLNKQNERLNALQASIEQAQNKKEQTRTTAVEVKEFFLLIIIDHFFSQD